MNFKIVKEEFLRLKEDEKLLDEVLDRLPIMASEVFEELNKLKNSNAEAQKLLLDAVRDNFSEIFVRREDFDVWFSVFVIYPEFLQGSEQKFAGAFWNYCQVPYAREKEHFSKLLEVAVSEPMIRWFVTCKDVCIANSFENCIENLASKEQIAKFKAQVNALKN